MSTALLLSGGVDSSALAYWQSPSLCFTLNYGQLPAQAEVVAAKSICSQLEIPHEVISIDCSSLGSGDLIGRAPVPTAHAPEWWPFRNQLLVTLCAMRAVNLGIRQLLLGSVQSDSIHRDGTREFIRLLDSVIAYQEGNIRLVAPALHMSSLELFHNSGMPMNVLVNTHSCHVGNIPCGRCRGCQRRFATFQLLGLESESSRPNH